MSEPIQYCRYYNGEEECPASIQESGNEYLWSYEKFRVKDDDRRDENNLNTREYTRCGLKDFNVDDGVPITLKALLFNRHHHWTGGYDMESDREGFKQWYLEFYLGSE
jgi:hypothetical protein